MFLQTFDRSPDDNISESSRKPSQKAAYMADTPTRVRKDPVARRYVFFFMSALNGSSDDRAAALSRTMLPRMR
jgi:hypothetical protein